MTETSARLRISIDFGAKWVDFCLLCPDRAVLLDHRRFGNTLP